MLGSAAGADGWDGEGGASIGIRRGTRNNAAARPGVVSATSVTLGTITRTKSS